MAHFEDLVVWQDAKTLTIAIYKIMRDIKDYGFRDQIQRASVSIMNFTLPFMPGASPENV